MLNGLRFLGARKIKSTQASIVLDPTKNADISVPSPINPEFTDSANAPAPEALNVMKGGLGVLKPNRPDWRGPQRSEDTGRSILIERGGIPTASQRRAQSTRFP